MGRCRAFGCLLFVVLLPAQSTAASTLTVAWDPAPSVAGYIVSWGTESGVYTGSVDVGPETSTQVAGLADGQRYYFIVRSYDSLGTTSLPSVEVSGVTPGTESTSVTIGCPVPSVNSPDGQPIVVTFAPTVAGGTAPVTTTCAPSSGSLFPVGTTPFSCTATDALEQTATCSSVVIVMSLPLAMTCPIIPSAVARNGSFAKVTYDDPQVTGGVAPVSMTCSPASGAQFPVGTTSVLCTATDATDATATCTTSVTVTTSGGSSTSSTGTPIEFDGTVSSLAGKCPSVTFQSNSQFVAVSNATTFTKGSCSALANGKRVHVKGLLQSTNQVKATAITFIK